MNGHRRGSGRSSRTSVTQMQTHRVFQVSTTRSLSPFPHLPCSRTVHSASHSANLARVYTTSGSGLRVGSTRTNRGKPFYSMRGSQVRKLKIMIENSSERWSTPFAILSAVLYALNLQLVAIVPILQVGQPRGGGGKWLDFLHLIFNRPVIYPIVLCTLEILNFVCIWNRWICARRRPFSYYIPRVIPEKGSGGWPLQSWVEIKRFIIISIRITKVDRLHLGVMGKWIFFFLTRSFCHPWGHSEL